MGYDFSMEIYIFRILDLDLTSLSYKNEGD